MSSQDPQDSWANRVNNVANVLGLTTKEVTDKLKKWGLNEAMGLEAIDDDDVTKLSDFVTRFSPDPTDPPMAQLRLAFKFLKGGKKSEDRKGVDVRAISLKQTFGIELTMETASIEALLAHYNPNITTDAVTTELKRRFGDRKIIAFMPASQQVAVAETIEFINDLEQGVFTEPPDSIMVDGGLVRLWPVGVTPNRAFEEDPLFRGCPLSHDRSTINHRSWAKVQQDCRQFCRVALDMSRVDPDNAGEVLTLIKAAEAGMKELAELYPQVKLRFDELAIAKQLPTLLIVPSTFSAPKANNPFGVGHNRRY